VKGNNLFASIEGSFLSVEGMQPASCKFIRSLSYKSPAAEVKVEVYWSIGQQHQERKKSIKIYNMKCAQGMQEGT
jgi:hypothetical protein